MYTDSSARIDLTISTDSFGFGGIPPSLSAKLGELDELSAVSPVRVVPARIEGTTTFVSGVDPDTFGSLVDLHLIEGTLEALAGGGIMVDDRTAGELSVGVGDTVDISWNSDGTHPVKVVGVYTQDALVGQWLTSISTPPVDAGDTPPPDFLVLARVADGVDAAQAHAAVTSVVDNYPDVQLRWTNE